VIQAMADHDVTKFERILKMKATEVFTHLTYMNDYNNEQLQLARRRGSS
jgi:hypothetical protein